MQQLVGRACVVCRRRISSVLEAKFCPACGNPVHNDCTRQKPQAGESERCSLCGGDVANPAAARYRFEWGRPAGVDRPGAYPVGRVCPACGHAGFRRTMPSLWVTFAMDRVCLACGTQYLPATPVWAGVVFILVGLVLVGIGLLMFLVGLDRVRLPGAILGGALALLGLSALSKGVFSFITPGKV